MSHRKRHLTHRALGAGVSLEGVHIGDEGHEKRDAAGVMTTRKHGEETHKSLPAERAGSDASGDGRRELAVVTDTPGGNILEVALASAIARWARTQNNDVSTGLSPSEPMEGPSRTLCRLPARFVKTLWVRRGSYVVIESDGQMSGGIGGEGGGATQQQPGARVTAEVAGVIMPKQVKAMRRAGEWPTCLDEYERATTGGSGGGGGGSGGGSSGAAAAAHDTGIPKREETNDAESDEDNSDEDDDFADIVVNRNRMNVPVGRFEEVSDSDDSDSESGSESENGGDANEFSPQEQQQEEGQQEQQEQQSPAHICDAPASLDCDELYIFYFSKMQKADTDIATRASSSVAHASVSALRSDVDICADAMKRSVERLGGMVTLAVGDDGEADALKAFMESYFSVANSCVALSASPRTGTSLCVEVDKAFRSLTASTSTLLSGRINQRRASSSTSSSSLPQHCGACMNDCAAITALPRDNAEAVVRLLLMCATHCGGAAREVRELIAETSDGDDQNEAASESTPRAEKSEACDAAAAAADVIDDEDDDEYMRISGEELEMARRVSYAVSCFIDFLKHVVRAVRLVARDNDGDDDSAGIAHEDLEAVGALCKKIREAVEDIVACCYAPQERSGILDATRAIRSGIDALRTNPMFSDGRFASSSSSFSPALLSSIDDALDAILHPSSSSSSSS